MRKGIIYARVSTEEQAKEGLSIESQLALCQQYAQQNQIHIVNIFADEGRSGSNTNRPALQELLLWVSDKKVNQNVTCMLVQDTDRFSRNAQDHLNIKAYLKRYNVQLISISQPMIDDSPEGRFIDLVLAGANAFQSQITGRKTSKVMEQKILAGWWASAAPLGYINTDNPNPTNSLDRRIIIPHPQTGPLVTKAFQLYSTGRYTIATLTQKLFTLGLQSKVGKAIQVSVIGHILGNPIYYGVLPWRGDIYPGRHKPLIDKDTWHLCQNILDQHNQHASRKRVHDYLLRGYIYCANCGSRYWAAPHRGRNQYYEYYFCKKCKKSTYVDVLTLERRVANLFKRVNMSKQYSEELIDTAKSVIKELRQTKDTDRQVMVNQLTHIEAQLREAEDRLLDRTIAPEKYKSIEKRLEAKQAQIESDLHKLNADYAQKFARIKSLANMAHNIHQTYKDAEPLIKRGYLELFFAKIYVRKGKIIGADPSEEIKPLIKEGKISVRVKSNWLPDLDSNQEPTAYT